MANFDALPMFLKRRSGVKTVRQEPVLNLRRAKASSGRSLFVEDTLKG